MQTALYKKMTILPETTHTNSDSVEGSLLKALAYFDIFGYPLLKTEISQFMDQPVMEAALDKALERLLEKENIFRFNGFYSIQDNSLLARNRIRGNIRADKLLPKAMKIGRFLSKFPYVKAIGISGSLSKHYADEKGDIDYFVITKANRLWIARTFMHIFKKFTFLAGKQHFYCMNYYIDEAALEVENKNIFTAMEIKTLLPAGGYGVLDNFFAANEWASNFLPSFPFPKQPAITPAQSWFKKSIEWVFNNKAGDRLDNYLLKISTARWSRKKRKGKINIKGQTMDLVTGKHFAWSNPASFQEKILLIYKEKLDALQLIINNE
jgi:hypothetical protein